MKSLSRTFAAVLLGAALGAGASESPTLPPLSSESGPRIPGKFVWADLVTDDVPAARRFYSRLLGWRFLDVGNYTVAYNEGRALCGMFQRSRPKDGSAHPRWFGYISVPSVSRARDVVTKA